MSWKRSRCWGTKVNLDRTCKKKPTVSVMFICSISYRNYNFFLLNVYIHLCKLFCFSLVYVSITALYQSDFSFPFPWCECELYPHNLMFSLPFYFLFLYLTVMPNFAEKVEIAVDGLSYNPPRDIDENEFIDASRLVYDAVRDIRQAVLLDRVCTWIESILNMFEIQLSIWKCTWMWYVVILLNFICMEFISYRLYI